MIKRPYPGAPEGVKWRYAFAAEVARLNAKNLGMTVAAIETQAVEVADADAVRRAEIRAYVPKNPRPPSMGDTQAEADAKTDRMFKMMEPRAHGIRPVTEEDLTAPTRSILSTNMISVPPSDYTWATKKKRKQNP